MKNHRVHILIFIAIFAFISFPYSCIAITIDSDEFFAYYKIPNRRMGNAFSFAPYIMLTKQPCKGTGIHPNYHPKHGVSYWPEIKRTRTECWVELEKEEIIEVCPVDDKTHKIGNACIDISKSRFIDTSTLPKKADF